MYFVYLVYLVSFAYPSSYADRYLMLVSRGRSAKANLSSLLCNYMLPQDIQCVQDRDKTQKGSISHEQLVEIFRIYEVRQLLGGVATLVADPPHANSTTRQNPPICNPSLYIVIPVEPIIHF